MSQYFENGVPPNAILDLPDAFSLYWKRRMDAAQTPLDQWFRKLEFRRLLAYEKKMLPQFNLSLVCSSEDQSYLQEQGINNVKVLPKYPPYEGMLYRNVIVYRLVLLPFATKVKNRPIGKRKSLLVVRRNH